MRSLKPLKRRARVLELPNNFDSPRCNSASKKNLLSVVSLKKLVRRCQVILYFNSYPNPRLNVNMLSNSNLCFVYDLRT